MKSLDTISQEPLSLSIVMPVHNEEEVIEKVGRNFCDTVLSRFEKKELILVDDCSTDATLLILERLQREYPYIRVLTNSSNQGHGPSLMRAYHEAKGEYIFHCDSDNQFMAEDFGLLWRKLKENNLELVMGYRRQRNDPMYRIFMSNALRLFNMAFFGVSFRDINAPFKLYTRFSLKKILSIVPRNAFIPTILMILAAHSYGISIGEVEVRHLPRLTGKSFIRNWRTVAFCFKAAVELIQFKRRLLQSSSKKHK